MADLPILFSTPMVQAINLGIKTETRRLAVSQRKVLVNGGIRFEKKPSQWTKLRPGDRLYVREGFALVSPANDLIIWQADFEAGVALGEHDRIPPPWTPNLHMPRKISRFTLGVKGVRVEPLHAITEVGSFSEGCAGEFGTRNGARDEYIKLWNSLHGADSWRENPDVVVISFDVQRCNIDASA